MSPRLYSTHRAAKLLGVSLPSIVNWVHAGLLEAHRTPGGHRRITADELARFCRANGMPVPDEVATEGRVQVLVVDHEADFAELVRDALVIEGYQVHVASSAFAAGVALGRYRPQVVLLDLDMPDLEPRAALQSLAGEWSHGIRVVGLTAVAETSLAAELGRAGLAEIVEKPVELGALTAAVRALARPG